MPVCQAILLILFVCALSRNHSPHLFAHYYLASSHHRLLILNGHKGTILIGVVGDLLPLIAIDGRALEILPKVITGISGVNQLGLIHVPVIPYGVNHVATDNSMDILTLLITHTLVALGADSKLDWGAGTAIHNDSQHMALDKPILTDRVNNLITNVKVTVDLALELPRCIFHRQHWYNITLKRSFVKGKVIHHPRVFSRME